MSARAGAAAAANVRRMAKAFAAASGGLASRIVGRSVAASGGKSLATSGGRPFATSGGSSLAASGVTSVATSLATSVVTSLVMSVVTFVVISPAMAVQPSSSTEPVHLAQAATPDVGQRVYEKWCAPCHAPGPDHPGTTALAALYKGTKPGALVDRADLTPPFVKQFVRHGVSVMPFFRKTEISDAELDALAAFLSKPQALKARG